MTHVIVLLLLIADVESRSQSEARPPLAPTLPEQSYTHLHEPRQHHWTAPQNEQRKRNPVKADKASLARGRALFQTHCVSCHGEHGEGDGPAATGMTPAPANLKTMAAHHTDGDLAWKIAQGRGPMPGWKTRLTSRDIWSVVTYLRYLARH